MTGAEASATGTLQHANADAHEPSTRELRALCLAAAEGIKDECRASLLLISGTAAAAAAAGECHCDGGGEKAADEPGRSSNASNPVLGEAHHHDDSLPITTITTSSSLAGCGAPLVQLLARQATCIVARYEPPSGRQAGEAPRADASLPAGRDRGRALHDDEDNETGGAVGGEPKAAAAAVGGGFVGGHLNSSSDKLVLKRLDDLLSIAYARFYAYLYKDLPLCWRQLYTDAAILKFSCLLLLLSVNNGGGGGDGHGCAQQERHRGDGINANVKHAGALAPSNGSTTMDEMVKTLDLALILAGAGGNTRGRAWIDTAFELLEAYLRPPPSANTRPAPAVSAPVDGTTNTPATPPPPSSRPTKRAKLQNDGDDPAAAAWSNHPSFSAHEPFTPPTTHPVRQVPAHTMPMAAFQHYLDRAPRDLGPQPLVLTGLADAWPARAERPWAKPDYLLSRTLGGRRLVPVEVGRSYVDAGWGQRIVRFAEFLGEFVVVDVEPSLLLSSSAEEAEGSNRPTAYLAQHQLLLQLPHLRGDILVPDLCYTAPPRHPTDPAQDQPELDEPMLNAWFGPPGTITPLHTDTYHNLLVQVVGRKYVRLYAPQESRRMRARGKEDGVEMGNTSLLDVGVVEGWDSRSSSSSDGGLEGQEEEEGDDSDGQQAEEERLLFKTVPFVDCILEPGDTLYIPIGWWHYVRGLSVSFSVSIWWN